jgi:large subunit ribosomal protein L29
MTFPKYKDLTELKNIVEIEQELFSLQKNLFELRLKRSTNQIVKPHLFLHAKRKLAQLKFKQSLLLKLRNLS